MTILGFSMFENSLGSQSLQENECLEAMWTFAAV